MGAEHGSRTRILLGQTGQHHLLGKSSTQILYLLILLGENLFHVAIGSCLLKFLLQFLHNNNSNILFTYYEDKTKIFFKKPTCFSSSSFTILVSITYSNLDEVSW